MLVDELQASARTVPTDSQRTSAAILLWTAVLAVGVLLSWLSIARYLGYNAGMLDLGNMAQAIASVQRGEPLIVTTANGPISRLAGHVELIYLLIAPLYALWPDPRLLLLVQAGLFALGALPVYWLALRHSHSSVVALALTVVYLFYPVAQTAVLFDFHGDTLAMPLLLFAIDALDRGSRRTYAACIGLALLCKVYVAIPVALLGVPIYWHYRDRRAALFTSGAGVIYGALAFFVIRRLFTTDTAGTQTSFGYVSFYFGQLQQIFSDAEPRLLNAIIVFGPALLLLRSGWRWLIPALPVAAAVLLSTGPGPVYDYRYHHYALVVSFIMLAGIFSMEPAGQASRLRARPRRQTRLSPRFLSLVSAAITLLFSATLVDTPLNPQFWSGQPGQGLDQAAFGITGRDKFKDRFLASAVPDDVPIAASMFLATHLANREVLYLVRSATADEREQLPRILSQVDYVLADALFDYRRLQNGRVIGGIAYERKEIQQLLKHPDFGLLAARDGLLVFKRQPDPAQVLLQQIETLGPAPQPRATFGPAPVLIDAELTLVGPRRVRASFSWSAPEEQSGTYVAISTLDGVEHARMVHLPSYTLLPVEQWQPGQVVRETFEASLPQELAPGRYTWRLGWYAVEHSEAYASGQDARVGQTFVVGEIVVP